MEGRLIVQAAITAVFYQTVVALMNTAAPKALMLIPHQTIVKFVSLLVPHASTQHSANLVLPYISFLPQDNALTLNNVQTIL